MEESYDVKNYQRFDHEYLLSTMEEPKKMEVTNQDTTELDTGLRRRLRNEWMKYDEYWTYDTTHFKI